MWSGSYVPAARSGREAGCSRCSGRSCSPRPRPPRRSDALSRRKPRRSAGGGSTGSRSSVTRASCLALAGVAVALSGAAGPGRAVRADPCDFGKPLSERVVMRPKAGTFYSVDVLNPDVVRRPGRYLLFFSGNSAHSEEGDWRTGVATGTRPEGPYRFDPRLHERFFNCGTALVKGRFFHAANVPERS